MMPGIPKFRKESHPERAKDKRRPIYSQLLLSKGEMKRVGPEAGEKTPIFQRQWI